MSNAWAAATGIPNPTPNPALGLPPLPTSQTGQPGQPYLQQPGQPPQQAAPPDWSMFSNLVRYNAMQAYDDYLRGYQQAAMAANPQGQRLTDLNVDPGADSGVQPLSPQQWIGQALDSEMGQVNLIDYLDLAYQRSNGHSMPPGERQAVQDAITNADANTKMQMLTQVKAMAGDVQSLISLGYLDPTKANVAQSVSDAQANAALGFSPTNPTLTNPTFQFITTAEQQYELKNPTALDTQQSLANAAAKRIDSYTTTFGQAPDAPTQQRLASMSDLEFQQMLSNVKSYYSIFGKMPDAAMQARLSGMSQTEMTAWQKNVTTLSQAWMDNFGSMPSDAQMQAASTMNGDALTEYINNSPSRVSGLNIGQFDGYKTALDPIYKKNFGHAAPDELVSYFHEAQQAG